MRLSQAEIDAIKQAASDAFGRDAVVRLFGSRVDDTGRGGDIDLHIEAESHRATPEAEVRFRTRVWQSLDEPEVDVAVFGRGGTHRWIDRVAYRTGIVL